MSDIAAWLENLGLGKYIDAFTEQGVDLDVLLLLSEQAVQKLGLSLGHRKKLFNAIMRLTPDKYLPESNLAVYSRNQLI